MFERVLIAMDLSPATEALVSSIPGLREFGTREIVLVHVAPPIREPVSKSLRRIEEFRERLDGLAHRLGEEGMAVSVEVPNGSPAAQLVEVAGNRDPNVILVGSRSHSRIREAFVGSVAWEVVRRARRPVLLQRIEANRPDPEAALEVKGGRLPKRVIHPTDFSETAERSLAWIRGLISRGVREVTLLHVLSDEATAERGPATTRLEEIAQDLRLDAPSVDVRSVVRVGVPHEEVLSAGGKSPENMVVMGTHGRRFLPEIVMGSVSRQVTRLASAAVLLIPSPAE